MFNPWFALTFQAAQLALEAQRVIALRLMRLARGGVAGQNEARLMVADKMAALTEAQVAALPAAWRGNSHEVTKRIIKVYGRRVRANRHRLSR